MRILILGPVANKKVSGGVAVFDEGLYNGFIANKNDCQIISINKSDNVDNLTLSFKKNKPIMVLFYKRKIARLIKKYKADLVISSLHYSLGIRTYKKYSPNTTFVHVVHGTPCSINGKLKAFLVNSANRYAKKYFDKLVTVSHLSYAINQKVNRVTCDEIINTGCLLKVPPKEMFGCERKYDFCYVGRLFKDKNIDLMMDALIMMKQKYTNLKVCIAGFGEQEQWFKDKGKYNLDFVDFLGKIDHKKVSEVYLNSKFFISLCSLEACGLAFSEAAIHGCNPIASLSSGQSPLFKKYGFYHEVSNLSSKCLYDDLDKIYENYMDISYENAIELSEIFDYQTIAQKYLKLIKK